MRNYGLEMKGGFVGEILTTTPSWTSDDEGRLIYTEDTEKYYYGDGTAWVEISSGSAGTSGTSGVAGTSGTSGAAGTSGTSGSGTGGSGSGDAANALPLVLPNYCSLDDTNDNVSRGSAFEMVETINFADSTNGSIWFTCHLPESLDTTSDISLIIVYNLSGSDDTSIVTFQTEYWIYGNGDTPAGATGSNSDNINTGVSGDGKRQAATLTAIPAADLTADETLTLKFTRLSTDTYTGTFQMLYVYMYQA